MSTSPTEIVALDRQRPRARARRHHHGRQRTVGAGARPAALRRPSARRRGGARRGALGDRIRHPLSDDLQLLVGELEPAGRRSRDADGPAQALHPQRPRRAARQRRPGARHRPARRACARHRGAARRSRDADARQPRPQPDRRLQLWRAAGDRRGGAQPGARGGAGPARSGARSTPTCSLRASARPTFPIPTSSSAPPANSGCRISCCGRRPTPSWCSCRSIGRTSIAPPSNRRWRNSPAASAASAAPARAAPVKSVS